MRARERLILANGIYVNSYKRRYIERDRKGLYGLPIIFCKQGDAHSVYVHLA
jgi:hypothetical protein